MSSKLIGGNVPAGESCPYDDECDFKDIACNGTGCPVSNGKTQSIPFSCGLARFFVLCNNLDDHVSEKLKKEKEDEVS